MKQFNNRVRFGGVLALAALATITPAHAQGGMPDLSDFAGAIAKSAEVAPPKKAAAPGVYKSGLNVPSVKPGEGAREIGRQLRQKVEAQAGPQPALKQLEDALPQTLVELEGFFVKSGFAKRDMGVAFGYAFLDLYETANKKTVPEASSKVAVRTFSAAVAKTWGPKFNALTPAAKEKMYETVIMSTTLNTLLATQFAKAGKKDEEASLRQTSASLFETLIGVPASQVVIANDGRISGLSSGQAKETAE